MTKDKKMKNKKKKAKYTAATADRQVLYQEAVQCPEVEVEFINRIFKEMTGRPPQTLREDFCGTSLLCCEWIKDDNSKSAVGVDLDPDVLNWGSENNIAHLNEDQQKRMTIVQENVLTADTDQVDVLVAFNFSYFLFMKRDELRDYFKSVRKHLKDDGVFFLDCYGGYEAQDEVEEERACDGFSYVWEQATFNPLTHETTCYIHFDFPDNTRIEKAFTYTWRLWILPEIQEILTEAGFSDVVIYWEGTEGDSEDGDGVFEPTTEGEICAGWIAYISARP